MRYPSEQSEESRTRHAFHKAHAEHASAVCMGITGTPLNILAHRLNLAKSAYILAIEYSGPQPPTETKGVVIKGYGPIVAKGHDEPRVLSRKEGRLLNRAGLVALNQTILGEMEVAQNSQ
jgi:hypothetical protein